MSLNCDVVKDLVVLYKDECINESTKKQIDEHLSTCNECKKYYKNFDKMDTQEEITEIPEPKYYKESDFSSVAKKLKFRTVLREVVFVASILATVFITLAVAKSIWSGGKGK